MNTTSEAPITFLLDGEVQRVHDLPATTTVLEYLREHLHRCGTKEGCAEGDCGACTVVLGELNDADAATPIRYRAVNACIRFLPTIDGKLLLTSESLADGNTLHPVQQSMVDHHGSQCGFCTPGFVMSLFALYQHDAAPCRESVLDAVSGNLCRCTGYRPIIEAGCALQNYPTPSRWSATDAQSPARVASLQAIQRTASLQQAHFCAPRSVDEFAEAYLAAPESLILAGGTDVGLWVTQQLRELPPLLYLGEVTELQSIEVDTQALTIGAAVPLSEAWPAIVAHYPTLAELAQRFASTPVRNSGTLCGNLANGSPIGDAMPALIALGATIELQRGTVRRRLPLEAFYLGYQKKDLQAGEFVRSVAIPLPSAHQDSHQRVASYKLAKRNEQDISAVCVGINVTVEQDRIVDARIAYGGMAATPKRASHAEAALIGQPWSTAAFAAAAKAIASDFSPLSDLRASADYRLQAAANLLRRYELEHSTASSASPHPLRVEAVTLTPAERAP